MRVNSLLQKLCTGDRSRLCCPNSWRFVCRHRHLKVQPVGSGRTEEEITIVAPIAQIAECGEMSRIVW